MRFPHLAGLRVAGWAALPGSPSRRQALDAIHDHNDIRDAVAGAARHPDGGGTWHAAVASVNLANGAPAVTDD